MFLCGSATASPPLISVSFKANKVVGASNAHRIPTHKVVFLNPAVSACNTAKSEKPMLISKEECTCSPPPKAEDSPAPTKGPIVKPMQRNISLSA